MCVSAVQTVLLKDNDDRSVFNPSLTADIDKSNMSEELLENYKILIDHYSDIFSRNAAIQQIVGILNYILLLLLFLKRNLMLFLKRKW